MIIKVITACSFLLLTGCWTNQIGQKTGILVKVSKEGMWHGTFEGELIRGGLDGGSGAIGKSFHFTISGKNLIKKSIDLMDKNKPVVINYHCEFIVAPWRGESNCFLDDIKAN